MDERFLTMIESDGWSYSTLDIQLTLRICNYFDVDGQHFCFSTKSCDE